MSSVFTQVAELFTRRQQKKAEDRESLVNSILDGGKKAPTAAQIASTLDEIGWNPEGLEKEVARRQQRRQYAALLAEVPTLEKKKTELDRKGNAEVTRYEAIIEPLRQEHRRIMDGLNGEFRYVVARLPEAQNIRPKLLQSYEGPLTSELDDNRTKQGELSREIHKAIKQAESHEHAASFTKRDESPVQPVYERGQVVGVVDKSTWWSKVSDLAEIPVLPPDEISYRTAAAKSLREGAAELQKQLDALVKREAEILEAMLLP